MCHTVFTIYACGHRFRGATLYHNHSEYCPTGYYEQNIEVDPACIQCTIRQAERFGYYTDPGRFVRRTRRYNDPEPARGPGSVHTTVELPLTLLRLPARFSLASGSSANADPQVADQANYICRLPCCLGSSGFQVHSEFARHQQEFFSRL